MAMVINSNIMSLTAQRNLSSSQAEQSQAMERLSSGLRINSAKDDAAGMAIASGLTSQVKGLNQAVRNANDGISLVQTAEGALKSSENILQRMRELSLQSANGTYQNTNRQFLNAEVTQLKAELTRIAEDTDFNGQKILTGEKSNIKLQVGSQANQTIEFGIGKMDAESLGVDKTVGVGSSGQSSTGADLATAVTGLADKKLGADDLVINGVSIGAANSAHDTASSAAKDASAISTAAAINEKADQTGVHAVVGETTMGGSAMTAAAATGAIKLNGVDINLQTTADAATTRSAVVDAINAKAEQTGVRATDSGTENGGVTLTAADGRNIVLETDANMTAANTGLGITDGANNTSISTGTVTLVADGGKEIKIESTAEGQASKVGLREGTFNGTATQVTSNLDDSTTAMAAGDVAVNGVIIGASYATSDTASQTGAEYSAIAKAAAFNAVSDRTGVTAVVNENRVDTSAAQTAAAAGTAMSLTINGVDIAGVNSTDDASENRQLLAKAINSVADQTGVRAVDTGVMGSADGGGLQLIADDGRNITVASATATAMGGLGVTDGTYVGEFTLQSDREIKITRGTNDAIANAGLSVGDFGGGEDGMAIQNVDISTAEGAQKAVAAIDNALTTVQETRADLGAVNNRLDHTITNLTNVSKNAAASRSRIEDADFGAETAALARAQVLQQAGTAMLSQANSAPQQVLSLLR